VVIKKKKGDDTMDFFGWFDDDFDEDEFMQDDLFEDNYEEDLEPFEGEYMQEDEHEQAESHDDFTAKDAFILGGAMMGFAYEEGLKDRDRKKRKKFREDSD